MAQFVALDYDLRQNCHVHGWVPFHSANFYKENFCDGNMSFNLIKFDINKILLPLQMDL